MVSVNIDINSRKMDGNIYYDYLFSYIPYGTMVGVASSLETTLNKVKEAILDMEEPTEETLKMLGYKVD